MVTANRDCLWRGFVSERPSRLKNNRPLGGIPILRIWVKRWRGRDKNIKTKLSPRRVGTIPTRLATVALTSDRKFYLAKVSNAENLRNFGLSFIYRNTLS